jgi:hypothetical protein
MNSKSFKSLFSHVVTSAQRHIDESEIVELAQNGAHQFTGVRLVLDDRFSLALRTANEFSKKIAIFFGVLALFYAGGPLLALLAGELAINVFAEMFFEVEVLVILFFSFILLPLLVFFMVFAGGLHPGKSYSGMGLEYDLQRQEETDRLLLVNDTGLHVLCDYDWSHFVSVESNSLTQVKLLCVNGAFPRSLIFEFSNEDDSSRFKKLAQEARSKAI